MYGILILHYAVGIIIITIDKLKVLTFLFQQTGYLYFTSTIHYLLPV